MKCGRLLSEKGEAAEEFCPACYGRSHSFEQGRVLYPYTDRVSESIYRFKYGGRERYAWFYGRWLFERYAMEINAWKPDALIPVPLHPSRMRDRGYNQAELIARRLSSLTGIPVRNDIVARSRKTAPQKLLGAEERRRNLKNAFKICQYDVKLETIVLIDDIYTTGSTVDEIGALLKSAGVSRVYVLVVAAGVAQ
jgi:ComF family protein